MPSTKDGGIWAYFGKKGENYGYFTRERAEKTGKKHSGLHGEFHQVNAGYLQRGYRLPYFFPYTKKKRRT